MVPSSSLIPQDPTLLLTTAGMVQFKPFFLGQRRPEYTRAASVQKCVRTTDVDRVGSTARHLTFFEMLGNFSFGDYFKEGATAYAWEFLTGEIGLDPDRLWITIYEEDEEAFTAWSRGVGIPEGRIVRLGKESNWWDMGVAGPCGPCSEVLYDRGEAFACDLPTHGVGCDCDQYLEVWNLVFMQYVRDEAGNIVGELESKGIDTGMGLERLASILQGVPSAFETDVIAPVLERAEEMAGVGYGRDPRTDVSLRIMADHARATAFLVADGVFPSNEGRGYVLRRIMRRAVRHARLLGIDGPVLGPLVERVVEVLGPAWPELVERRQVIARVSSQEEEVFGRTLRQGLAILSEELETARASGRGVLGGDVAFRLHDTYGFPVDLTLEIAREAGLAVDREAFARLMDEQRRRAREARVVPVGAASVFEEVLKEKGPTLFLGYERLEAEGVVQALLSGGTRVRRAEEGEEVEVVLSRTPFYAGAGGQVGDRGELETPSGRVRVEDTKYGVEGLIVHRGKVVAGEVSQGEEALARVDRAWREGVRRSHTATHVLHWVLRRELGEHARQAGSLVEPGRLRFDFPHYEPLSGERVAELEWVLNETLAGDAPVRAYETSREYAEKIGALALFGEKYGEFVRVVEVGDFSIELCGGTHVDRTSQVGVVKIVSETGIGANLRRVEALAGLDALAWVNRELLLLDQVASLLRSPAEQAPERLRKVLANLKALEEEVERLRARYLAERARELAGEAAIGPGGLKVVVREVEAAGGEELRRLALAVRDALEPAAGAVVLGAREGGRASLVAAVSREAQGMGVSAREILIPAARAVGGGAGGREGLAQAGGSRVEGLQEALAAAASALARAVAERK